MELTEEALKQAKFRGPVCFSDGANGLAQQDFECVDNKRFGYSWRRENHKDKGRQFYTVDGAEVSDLSEAIALLLKPPSPDSPKELLKASIDEFKSSPKLNYGASRALSEARCNASAGSFGMVRASMGRSENAWHQGINMFSELERDAGRDFPHWLYLCKYAAHESSRGSMLLASDRNEDTDLHCALGKKCRDCAILNSIELRMEQQRNESRFNEAITDQDIDHAKVWTCIGHILQESPERVIDGAFFYRKGQEILI
jgi:hypothetical protein